MNESEARLTVRNSIGEIARAAAWLDRFAVGSALPLDLTSSLHVALDEVLSNVVRHGLRGAADGTREIGLSLRRRGDTVELAVEDDGPEFNPALYLRNHIPESCRDRRGGGVGLRFVTYLTDDLDFVRLLGRNQLTLRMRLPGGNV